MTSRNRKKYPPVVVVDENDTEIGAAMLAEAWEKGLYHRIVSVFVLDDQGRMLLQLRSSQVGIYPNCWDQAAGGHVDEGYSYDRAATMELAEELGLLDVHLETLGTFRSNEKFEDGRILNRFERVYVARVSHDVVLKPAPEEVSKLQWFTPSELKAQLSRHHAKFTPGLLHGLRTYFPAYQK